MTLPGPVIEEHEGFLVVRDDLLYGGTKRRALERCFLPGREYVFASPAEGHAQLAIALAARTTGARATLFVAKRSHLAPRTALAQEQGARIIEVPAGRLSVTQARARSYAEEKGAELLALGARSDASEHALTAVCGEVEARLRWKERPARVWLAVGSGTLARCAYRAFGTIICGVVVGHQPKSSSLPTGRWYISEQPFSAAAHEPPPYPSSPNYDAKVWGFARQFGEPGDLIWNVA